jgi:hypothetical protein
MRSEHELQKACVKWFGYQYPEYKDLLIAIPNGGKRHLTTAKKLKAEGAKAGVPDLLFALPKTPFASLWIEMKTEKGVISEKQKHYINRLQQVGFTTSVCRSFDEFERTITDYINGQHF